MLPYSLGAKVDLFPKVDIPGFKAYCQYLWKIAGVRTILGAHRLMPCLAQFWTLQRETLAPGWRTQLAWGEKALNAVSFRLSVKCEPSSFIIYLFIYLFAHAVCLPAREWHMRARMTADMHDHSRGYSKTASESRWCMSTFHKQWLNRRLLASARHRRRYVSPFCPSAVASSHLCFRCCQQLPQ